MVRLTQTGVSVLQWHCCCNLHPSGSSPNQARPNLIVIHDQGLSHHDEISGYEHEVVVTSPVKGRNFSQQWGECYFLV